MKNAQSTLRRDIVVSISIMSVVLTIYALMTCYGRALTLLFKSGPQGIRHDESVQLGDHYLRDDTISIQPMSIDLMAREDDEEQKDDPTPSSDDNSSSTTDLTSSESSTPKSFSADLLSKTWFRVVLALLGIVVLHMLCVCFHHVYHVLSRGTKPYGKLEYSQSPF